MISYYALTVSMEAGKPKYVDTLQFDDEEEYNNYKNNPAYVCIETEEVDLDKINELLAEELVRRFS